MNTKAELGRQLYAMVKMHYTHALQNEIEGASRLAAAEMGTTLWKQNEDNVFDRCPYNIEAVQRQLETLRAKRQELDALLEYVVQTFINGGTPL